MYLSPEVGAVGGGHQTVAYASNVVRFELPSSIGAFSTTSVSTIDLAAVDPDLRGFSDGVVNTHNAPQFFWGILASLQLKNDAYFVFRLKISSTPCMHPVFFSYFVSILFLLSVFFL